MTNKKYELAIIGDNFMLNQEFEEALIHIKDSLNIRHLQLQWPNKPMIGAGQQKGEFGLKEYLGDFEEVTNFLQGAECLINHLAPISANMLNKLPDLKFISIARGGPINIDIEACKEKNIVVQNVPGRNASAVAEFTIGAILSQTRIITTADTLLKNKIWEHKLYRYDRVGIELKSQTIGLIGYGKIGKLVVDYLLPMCSTILISDPYVELLDKHKQAGVTQVDLDELLAKSDIISMHPRVTKETTLMINRATISKMKQGVFFINTARGPLVNYNDLKESLRNKKIKGAFLDTFDKEPLDINDEILAMSNVTLSPHIAGASIDTVKYAAKMCAQSVENYIKKNGEKK